MQVLLTIIQFWFVIGPADTIFAKLPIRLSGKQKPFHYRLWFKFDDYLRFEGKSSIGIQVTEPTDVITLHIDKNNINVTDITVWSLYPSVEIPLKSDDSWAVDVEVEEGLSIMLGETIDKGSYRIDIQYTANLCQDTGIYRKRLICGNSSATSYTEFATTFEPIGARSFFPCFDEPYMKAPFSVSITHSSDLKALSNGRILNVTAVDSETSTTYFETTPRMSTYLLTISIGKFLTACNTSSHNVLVCSHVSASIEDTDPDYILAALDKYISYLDLLTNHFQIGYPLSKLDIVSPPNRKYSAMENWGIIVHGYDKLSRTRIIVHEVVHQWFGNLVTVEDWCDIWLNEGLTHYFAAYFTDNHTEIFDDYVWKGRPDPSIALKLSCPFADPNNLTSIEHMFKVSGDAIFYQGAATTKMLLSIMGEDDFFKGLRSYLLARAYGSANSDHLLDHLSLHSNLAIKEIMDSWVNKAGLPEVHVFVNGDSYYLGQVQANRERSLKGLSLSDIEDLTETIWQIPITFISQYNRTESDIIWLTDRIRAFPEIEPIIKSGQWYLLNPGHNVPYIVKYDTNNWELLLNIDETAEDLPALAYDDKFYIRFQSDYFNDTLANFIEPWKG